MTEFVMELYLDTTEQEIHDILVDLKQRLGERVRSRTLVRASWELERRPVPPPMLVHTVNAPRQRKLA
jgi:hypothetical protein